MRYCSESFQLTEFVGLTVFSQQYYWHPPAETETQRLSGDFVRHEHAAARVRRRIQEWAKEQGHGSKTRLAKAVTALYGESHSRSWVTDLLDGPEQGGQDLRLKDLDAIAIALGTQPGDLVRRDDNLYAEVTPTELRLLRFYRAQPDTVRHHFVTFFDYLFTLQQLSIEQQQRDRARKVEEDRTRRRRKDPA